MSTISIIKTNRDYIKFTLNHIYQLGKDVKKLDDSVYVEQTLKILRKSYKVILDLYKAGDIKAVNKCRDLQETIIFYEFDIYSRLAEQDMDMQISVDQFVEVIKNLPKEEKLEKIDNLSNTPLSQDDLPWDLVELQDIDVEYLEDGELPELTEEQRAVAQDIYHKMNVKYEPLS